MSSNGTVKCRVRPKKEYVLMRTSLPPLRRTNLATVLSGYTQVKNKTKEPETKYFVKYFKTYE